LRREKRGARPSYQKKTENEEILCGNVPIVKKQFKEPIKKYINFGGEATISLCSVHTAELKSSVMERYS